MTYNDLIYEFLGWEFTNCVTTIPGELCGSSMPSSVHRNHLDFKSDWKLLMFLVDKIEQESYKGVPLTVEIREGKCSVWAGYHNLMISESGLSRIEAVHYILVSCIKLLNSIKDNTHTTVRELILELRKVDPDKIVSIVVGDEDSNIIDTPCFELHSVDNDDPLEIFVPKDPEVQYA